MKIAPFILLFTVSAFAQTTNPLVNVRAWGLNTSGQCNVPSDLTNAVAIAAGWQHSVALRSNGTVVAWGRNDYGMCNVPPGLTNVVAIGAGMEHSMALTADGTVVTWGWDYYQQCDVPPGLTGVIAISAGGDHSLALRADGIVVAWGRNSEGQCNVPPDLTNAVAVAGGFQHSFAIRADGTVAAWGSDSSGQTQVPVGLSNIIAIATSSASLWAVCLTANGTVVSWNAKPPVPPDWTNAVAVGAGPGWGLEVRADGAVSAWWGGDVVSGADVPTDLPRASAVSAGMGHSLSLHASTLPTIMLEPKDQSAACGSTIKFSVRAVGMPLLAYQWYLGTTAIDGATNFWLNLVDVQPVQSGAYTVVVTNSLGSTTSRPAVLNVFTALDLNMVPAIALRGGEGLTYHLDYINALGPTNAWITLATVVITNSGQLFFDSSAIGQPARLYRLMQLP